MRVTAFLCNHAETQNNMLYISGAGIDRSFVAPGAPAPYQVSLALAIMVGVPWTATNEQHKIRIVLNDADGHPVLVPGPDGPDTLQPIQAEVDFNVGRPPGLTVGEEQNVSLAINMPIVPLPKLGTYRFDIEIDGSAEAEVPYRLVSLGTTMTGIGPGALPRF